MKKKKEEKKKEKLISKLANKGKLKRLKVVWRKKKRVDRRLDQASW
ncbi:unnamed protein product [marine sediment metagenome]|uniref:Uncharacterized protein n=1 Tax=marine sediment metagenome TaxID=412755 RepID=X1REV8_9ZZZZ